MKEGHGGGGLGRLLVPLKLARPQLQGLIAEGQDLIKEATRHRFYGGDHARAWEQLCVDAESWSGHTSRVLDSWFSGEDVAVEFTTPRGKELVTYIGRSPKETSRTYADLNDQVHVLGRLIHRLEIYSIPTPRLSDSPPGSQGSASLSYITYNIRGPVGQLIAGEGHRVNNINNHIAAMMGQAEPQVAAALQRLAEVALNDRDLDQRTRADVLETIEDLAEAAEAQPEKRKTGRIKGAIAVIGSAAGAATQLGEAWQQWGPVITPCD